MNKAGDVIKAGTSIKGVPVRMEWVSDGDVGLCVHTAYGTGGGIGENTWVPKTKITIAESDFDNFINDCNIFGQKRGEKRGRRSRQSPV